MWARICASVGRRILREQLGALDDHAVVAVAALRRLLVDQRLLQRMQRRRLRQALLLRIQRRQALERGHRLAGDRRDRRHAGADLDAVGEHRAGAALREPAAEARSFELELVRQHVEQGRVRACASPASPAIHLDLEVVRHSRPPVSPHMRLVLIQFQANGPLAREQAAVLPGSRRGTQFTAESFRTGSTHILAQTRRTWRETQESIAHGPWPFIFLRTEREQAY